jgi:polyisoprenoid-binding protein YceI
VDSFPTMTFKSRNVVVQGNQVRVLGDLTLRGVTKPVLLTGTYEGMFTDPWGGTRTAFIASTTINRHDFGVSFNGPFMEIGQIGDEVYIEIAIEAVKN